MVAALKESLLDESKRDVLLRDVLALIDAEVSDKKGASGLAVKAGYGAVKKVGPSYIERAVEQLWPEFVDKLEPLWQSYNSAPVGSFSDYLVANSDQASDALLAVTDERIDETDKSVVKKFYGSLRGSAKKNVAEALPRVGDLVTKYAG
ncbi:hypothetical protein E5720_14140 [Rhodococcus sp. PAMC28707]|uniref:DUF6918 family protein n=1 Tax=unclassified Rhodococcus (in: high G+C Gram-positive bacteria) TaxID=192944 RepID=UPI00109E041E|nr:MULTISPECIES: hypothetical protein [unclassified Rhodococcus (in: high G+C Gram-positive bacteria)]QCB52369.1 hypothetical protein E5769_21380 [Rhodococcus sp. PAMC28705]QCB59461.1 hypothetical protein E5720_14140 [Rhodococcus sp. PAMC28707]